MTLHHDDTQPKRNDVFPPDADPMYPSDYQDDGPTGPGCLVWGLMGVFGVVVSIAIVILSALAGFNQGVDTINVTSDALTRQFIARQCEIIPTDIAEGRLPLVENRYTSITINGTLPDCAQAFVPAATQAYQQSLITPTSAATATPTSTATPTTDSAAPETTPEATAAVSDSDTASASTIVDGYDLDALLQEGRDFMAEGDYENAIDTFDAINAIDDTYQTSTVNSLLFNALTQRALELYRTPGGSLAQAIILTNRAEQFGSIQNTDLPFERDVAQIYLDAEPNLNVNYPLAINLLNQVIVLSPNYPRGTGQASQLLFEQLEAYGDALLLGGDACGAQSQFTAALSLRPQAAGLSTKNATATTQCTSGVTAVASTVDPNETPATPDPNATPLPTSPPPTPTTGVAPVGQPGG